jgi:hypothetical protein
LFVSVITPSNANTSADNRSQVTSGNNTNAPDNIKQTQDPFNPNNHSNQASSETVNNDLRLPPGFPKPLPPLDKDGLSNSFCCCSLNGTAGRSNPAIRLSILAIMPSASAMSASV